MKLPQYLLCLTTLSFLSCALPAQTPNGKEDTSLVKTFVQEFYTWYVPMSLKGKSTPVSVVSSKSKGALFSAELVKALHEDNIAQSKSPDEIVGLDFDPFLNTQDPANRYETGKVRSKGANYEVEVFALYPGRKRGKPDVVVEVASKDGHFHFVNFHYPQSENLLSILKTLAADRSKTTK
ncbi:hypothetical protein BH11VER1_BH11VER1_20890 [soil metagenome]